MAELRYSENYTSKVVSKARATATGRTPSSPRPTGADARPTNECTVAVAVAKIQGSSHLPKRDRPNVWIPLLYGAPPATLQAISYFFTFFKNKTVGVLQASSYTRKAAPAVGQGGARILE